MRVLRLDLGGRPVELHPFVTVVRGLAPEARQRLLEAFAGIPEGRTDVGGLIEAHGILLDLAPATLGLLDLSDPHPVLVRAADLPNRGVDEPPELTAARRSFSSAERALAAAEVVLAKATLRRDGATEALEIASSNRGVADVVEGTGAGVREAAMARAEAERSMDEARRRHAEALEELDAAEREAQEARDRRHDATRAVSVAVAALEAASERRDPTAAALVEAATRRLHEAEASLDAVRQGDAPAPPAEATATDDVRTRRLALEAALLALDTTDPLPVRLALEQLRSGSGIELVASPEAMALADLLARLEIDLVRARAAARSDSAAGPGGHLEEGDARAVARSRVEAAELAVAQLESGDRGPLIDPGDVAELDRVHDEVQAARDAVGKRFGAGKGARRLEEAMAAEQAVLDRMGFVTYTEYLLGAGSASASATVDTEAASELLARARQELADAERDHEAIDADVTAELRVAELLDLRRQLRVDAVDLLGDDPGDDLEGALRRHRLPASVTGEHLQRLRQALEGAGLALVDEDVDERLLADLARVWLREQRDTESHRHDLERQIAAIDVELASAEARDRGPALDEPLAAAAGAVEDARVGLVAAEARLVRDQEAAAHIEELRAAFEAATGAESAAAAAVGAVEAAVVEAAGRVREVGDVLRATEAAASTAAAAEAATADQLAAIERQVAAARADGLASLEAEVRTASLAHDEATVGMTAAARAVGVARAAVTAAESAATEAGATGTSAGGVDIDGDGDSDVEDVEWYLLARLAAQRSVSYAGSVPLILDDALSGFTAEQARGVLDRLERMAATVQLVVVTEDLATASWAEGLGPERAHVIEA